MLFGGAPAQAHDGTPILLGGRPCRVEEMAHIVDADYLGHIDHAGLDVHLGLNEMRACLAMTYSSGSGFPSTVNPYSVPAAGWMIGGAISQNASATSRAVLRFSG